mmetsp:Transcript_10720/g.36400  ORF Transcript_10720/g.36400 Transcript_10720/m.36400 type:complete len:223 (+) Transcript_10720:263-931(+)
MRAHEWLFLVYEKQAIFFSEARRGGPAAARAGRQCEWHGRVRENDTTSPEGGPVRRSADGSRRSAADIPARVAACPGNERHRQLLGGRRAARPSRHRLWASDSRGAPEAHPRAWSASHRRGAPGPSPPGPLRRASAAVSARVAHTRRLASQKLTASYRRPARSAAAATRAAAGRSACLGSRGKRWCTTWYWRPPWNQSMRGAQATSTVPASCTRHHESSGEP